jgi:glycosyltransferase involved in cell wall biosynthesis
MGKKILICCNAYPPNFIGGAELIAHAQAKQLQSLGYNVIIFTGDTREHGKRHARWREDFEGLPVHRIYLTYEDYDPKFVNFTNKDGEEYFKTILKKFSPDIVHFHNLIGLSVGLIHIAKQQGIKTVLTLHDHWGFCFKNTIIKNNNEICRDFTQCTKCMEVIPDETNRNIPMRMRQDFMAMQLEDINAFISPSQYLADAYVHAGIPQERMHVIWNGIDVGKFSHTKKIPDPDHIRFTFIGYFGKHKGIQILLDALQYLKNKEKVTINLIGDGELFTQYKNEVNNKNLNNVVKFWGKIKNIQDAYAQTDVFILPSIWPENQPVTITEAMAAGIPVIAANSGGIPELIEHGKTGFLFETGNAWDLAKKMSEIIEEPENIKIFGENAFEKIKTDTMENQVEKIIEVYNQIPEKRREISDDNTIIVCHGKHVDPMCADILKILSKNFSLCKIRFILSDWLYDDQLKTGALFWIVDECEDPSAVYFGLSYDLPLLVPEKKQELKKLCVQFNCGLFYRDYLEAGYAIQYILNNEKERIMMIKNGVKARISFPDLAFRK